MNRLGCIFGRHRWTPHVEHGKEYNVCSRCGKPAREKPTPEQYAEADRVVNAPPPWTLSAVAVVAAKKLRCWLGLHRWVRRVNDEGKTYRRCAHCGKFRDTPDVTYTSGFG